MGIHSAAVGQEMSASKSKSQVESDLDLARERLSFYEQFDEIIKQNIASSSALLKEASARMDGDFAAERSRYRAMLADILEDVSKLQAQSEQIARRVADALEELEGTLPVDAAAPALAKSAITAEAPPEAAAVVEAAVTAERAKPQAPKPVESEPPAATAREVADSPAPSASGVTASVSAGAPSTSTALLVHGVPRASAALALKSYIEKLDFVSSVEPREFAAGLLRLQVDGTRPLGLDDLSGWNMADRIRLRTSSGDLLEVDLTSA